MTTCSSHIKSLRQQRGWSQEKLAAITGLSERTIGRVEKGESFSFETQTALAMAFEVSPAELVQSTIEPSPELITWQNDWAGAIGLFIMGLVIPSVILLTGTNGIWELVSASLIMGLTIVQSCMAIGIKQTYRLFDNTSWLVRYPSFSPGLDHLIEQAHGMIKMAYIIGSLTSLIAGLTLIIHQTDLLQTPSYLLALALKPVIYSALFAECWFRPYTRKMQKMLRQQNEHCEVSR